jgi:hypothetical protein
MAVVAPVRRKGPVVTLPPPAARVRVYLLGCVALRFGLLAMTYAVSADRLTASPTFDVVELVAPVRTFAWVFAVVAVAAIGGALFPRERPTRALLWVCTVIELLFGSALLFSWTWSPAIAAFLPWAVADTIVAGIDMRPRHYPDDRR